MSGVAKLEKWQVIGFDPCQAATDALHERCGLRACDDEIEVTQQADVILIAVKPQHVQGVVEKIAPHLDGKILVSLAAGVSLRRIKTYSGDTCPTVVIMPNTPAMVGEGCCALCLDDPALNEEQKKLVLELFSAISTTVVLHESHIPEFSAFIGSGPAFIFHLLESFVEVGLRLGFSYHDAKRLQKNDGRQRPAGLGKPEVRTPLRMNACRPAAPPLWWNSRIDGGTRGHHRDRVGDPSPCP
ncbi:MAG: pyrroline-5-carboxylate reductase family protein [Bilophila wadsworthia]